MCLPSLLCLVYVRPQYWQRKQALLFLFEVTFGEQRLEEQDDEDNGFFGLSSDKDANLIPRSCLGVGKNEEGIERDLCGFGKEKTLGSSNGDGVVAGDEDVGFDGNEVGDGARVKSLELVK